MKKRTDGTTMNFNDAGYEIRTGTSIKKLVHVHSHTKILLALKMQTEDQTDN